MYSETDKQLRDELEKLRTRVRQLEAAEVLWAEAAQRLRESEESYHMLLAAVSAYRYQVLVSNGTAISTKHGSGCIAVTGYTPADYERNDNLWFSMVHPEDRSELLVRLSQVLAGEQAAPIEHRIFDSRGEIRWVRNTMVPYRDDTGKVVRYDGVVENITERKRAEQELAGYRAHLQDLVEKRTRELEESREQLRHSERLASIGTLAAGIAHEINNPVGGILLAAQYALSAEANDVETKGKALVDIENHAKRCREIITNVLRFAREEAREKSPSDINTAVQQAHELLKEYLSKKPCAVALSLSKEAAAVMMNLTEIEQVIVNLIRNAIEARATMVSIQTRVTKQSVRLAIEDNGVGIPKDQQQYLFDPFFTTRQHEGGTGLGLSITHGIVKDHGGSIIISSLEGRGTTVTVTLPRHIDQRGF